MMMTFREGYLLILLFFVIITIFLTFKGRAEIVRKKIYVAFYWVAFVFFLLSYLVNALRTNVWGIDLIITLILLRDIGKDALYGLHRLGYLFLVSAITGSVLAVFNKEKKDDHG